MKLDQPLKIFPTGMHPCSYIPGRIARNAVVDPDYEMTPDVYDYLIQNGFRRSGEQVYRPYCHTCEECITTRIPVKEFERSRSQKRIWKSNQDIVVKVNQSGFKDEYLPIYQRYLESRHESLDYEEVERFLSAGWCDITFYEFYQIDSNKLTNTDNITNSDDVAGKENSQNKEQLIGIAVTDQVKSGLSAVYTFFDPEFASKRSLGVFAILWQIEEALKQELDYVYPGFWIKDCRKMNYKSNYQPIEGLIKGKWVQLEKGS